MPFKKKDDANDDAESVNSSYSNGSLSTSRHATKRARQSLNKSTNNQSLKIPTIDLAKEFHDLIRNYRNNNGRLLCECFIRLPTKRTNLDYYEAIKQPIDLIKIQQRLKTDEYETFQQFDDDILLLFTNAQQFYEKDSLEYKDANELKEVYESEKTKKFESNDLEDSMPKPSSKRVAKKDSLVTVKVEAAEENDKSMEDNNESEDDANSKNDPPGKKKSTRLNKSPTKAIRSATTTSRRKTLDNLNTSANSETSDTSKSKKVDAAKNENFDIYLEDYFDAICSYQDDSQRYLANAFYLLPEVKDYPDYYDTIKNPIDLKQIARRIMSSNYTTIKQMQTDLILMIDNAKRYNEPKSIIYKDASKLRVLTNSLGKKITGLMGQGKFLPSSKNREKKQKLLEEIAQTDHEEFQQLLQKSFEESQLAQQQLQGGPEHDEEEDEDDEDSEDDDDEELETKKTESKKLDLTIDENSMDVSLSNSEQKRPGRKPAPVDPVSKNLMKSMWSVFDYIKEFKQLNRSLSDPFVKLPSKSLYPDYYEDIKKPMALNCIKRKLNKRLFLTAREFFDDFELIFRNAMQYNVEESLIYKDANLLLDELSQKRKEISSMIDTVMVTNSPKTVLALTPSKLKQKKPTVAAELSKQTPIKAPNLNVGIPKFSELKEKLLYLYNFINDFQHEGRDLAPPFRLVPSKLEYPDYYNVIKKPIDMTKILNKINHHKYIETYSTIDDMCIDFAQMFENACVYNEPASTLYKDALNLQRALFNKRDEMVQTSGLTTSEACFAKKDPVNEFQAEIDFIKTNGYVTNDFIGNAVQSLLEYLFEQCMQFQDMEGRILSESFLDLYNLFEVQKNPVQILTFNMIRERLNARIYKRMDTFQDEMFQVFNQIRINSYLGESKPVDGATFDVKIHRYSQLFRDAYELQRYFIQKRDEVCSNGELLQTGALSFKLGSLDQYIMSITNAPVSSNFDDIEILQVDKRYKNLESQLATSAQTPEMKNYEIGNFYYLKRDVVKAHIKDQYIPSTDSTYSEKPLICCMLASDAKKTKFVFQIYLQKEDVEFIDGRALNIRRYFNQECYKSDLYALIDSSHLRNLKQCIVIGVKEHINSSHVIAPEEPPAFSDTDLFICESIYSTFFKFFRKIMTKKWTPLVYTSPHASVPSHESITVVKRSLPLNLIRNHVNQQYLSDLVTRVGVRLASVKFNNTHCETVAYDSAPAAALAHQKEKGDEDYEMTNIEEDAELMKKATYYEQVLYTDGELYKLGDYVYVKDEKNQNNEQKPPMIVRIDRLWSIDPESSENSGSTANPIRYYIRGALFLRPTDLEHEPTRLFYKNEVFKEISKEQTASLDQIVASKVTKKKKCSVMNSKKYLSCRLTEIDEQDVFVCEAKYSLQQKTFRKFTRGLKKFELTMKCNEDEVYFLRHELQLHKQLSPLLVNMFINYDEEMPAYETTEQFENQDSHDEEWSDNGEPNLHDENSSQSFISNRVSEITYDPNSPITPSLLKMQQQQLKLQSLQKHGKKVRVKRLKKCGYNIFSKEFRKSLRDTKSSLSFIDMSKEVGNRWRALTDQQRSDYEEKAKRETIIESQKMAAEQAAAQQKAAAEAAQQATMQAQNQNFTNGTTAGFMNQQNVMVLSPQTNGQTIQMVNNQMYLSQNTNIINTNQPQQVMYLNQAPNVNRQMPLQSNQYLIPSNPVESQLPKQENVGPKQVQHKEAYIKYIANMRKQQQLYTQPPSHVSNSISIIPDWHTSLDTRSSKIKENKVSQPPSSWIENVPSSEVMQHLLSMRYYLLNDAVNIKKSTDLQYDQQNEDVQSKEYAQLETCKDI